MSESLAPGLNLPTEPAWCRMSGTVSVEAHVSDRSFLVPVDYNWNEAES